MPSAAHFVVLRGRRAGGGWVGSGGRGASGGGGGGGRVEPLYFKLALEERPEQPQEALVAHRRILEHLLYNLLLFITRLRKLPIIRLVIYSMCILSSSFSDRVEFDFAWFNFRGLNKLFCVIKEKYVKKI